ncbi:OsmC family protein [Rhizobium leguminosarum]|uniref:OsmC family protein n=1 Tax=Rhizobium leguminosarum TaxID=384 RepID=UPI00098EE1B6|nr:OsmC family protein [Rhizobium leguminosarum]ASS57995.1 redox protein [Rhizobium leguminosarum bv. viciae]ASS58958.1 redox protein [Rhizobium leguminosarum bv. viciae]MBB4333247.1 organic hydroperoxide reductase OsmC/OhrA [Rhizobium leguminosarum]MBB4358924.1 organic hydroperoxide reductase OsmC/OhrA [Rhizobium leguminosarum]MBB4390869.1 organic hydroperoxide reductase OsmC/OhrA [Rhizobium leguminosarum]
MSEHIVRLEWEAVPHEQQKTTYSRDHKAIISPTVTIPVSAAAEYLGNASLADPEQLLVNALASCHMLYFLAICEGSGYAVTAYQDDASGRVSKNPDGGMWVSDITLRPKATFSGEKQPDRETLRRLHDRAHKGCFIANSIKCHVSIEIK